MRKFILFSLSLILIVFININTYAEVTYSKGLKYLDSGQKDMAASTFLEYYKYNKTSEYAPWALYHYILLSNSIDETISLSKILITKYPDFKRIDEIINYNASMYYILGDYNNAINQYKELFHNKKYTNSKYRVDALYYLGRCYMFNKNYEDAITNFELIEKMYPTSEMIDRAEYSIAEAYFYQGNETNIKKAINVYSKLLKNKNHPEYAGMLYRTGLCYINLGHRTEGEKLWKILLQDYSECFEADFVKDKLPNIKVLTKNKKYDDVNVTKTGNYYLQIGVYKNNEFAEEVLERMKKLGFKGNIRKYVIKGTLYYQLYLGFYQDRKDAVDMKLTLRQKNIDSLLKSGD